MIKMRHTPIVSIHLLMLLALLIAVPDRVFAKDGTAEIPEHASAKKYGSGWECDRGYREVKDACIAVKVPTNAYPTYKSYGRGWESNRGYREEDETCVSIKLPPNAYLNSSGIDRCHSTIASWRRPDIQVEREMMRSKRTFMPYSLTSANIRNNV